MKYKNNSRIEEKLDKFTSKWHIRSGTIHCNIPADVLNRAHVIVDEMTCKNDKAQSTQMSICMQAGKRSSLEIFVSILSCLTEAELKKTHITHKANLDSRLASKYVNSLAKLNLISKKEPSFYVITARGRDFLKQYEELIEMIDPKSANTVQSHLPKDNFSPSLYDNVLTHSPRIQS